MVYLVGLVCSTNRGQMNKVVIEIDVLNMNGNTMGDGYERVLYLMSHKDLVICAYPPLFPCSNLVPI